MNTAEQILVVILATALAVLLVLAIIVCIQLIRLMKVLQVIALKAENFVESAEAMGEMVKQTVGKLSLLKFVSGIVDFVKHKQDK